MIAIAANETSLHVSPRLSYAMGGNLLPPLYSNSLCFNASASPTISSENPFDPFLLLPPTPILVEASRVLLPDTVEMKSIREWPMKRRREREEIVRI